MKFISCIVIFVVTGCSFYSKIKTEKETPKNEAIAESSQMDSSQKGGKTDSEPILDSNEAAQSESTTTPKNEFKKSMMLTSGSENQDVPKLVVNNAPRFTSVPIFNATSGKEYSYQVQVVDDEKDSLELSLVENPFEMNMNEKGLIKWTPSSEHVGTQSITVKVQETGNSNHYALQAFSIEVVSGDPIKNTSTDTAMSPKSEDAVKLVYNQPPSITSKPKSLKVYATSTFSYQATATDPEKNDLEFSLIENPGDMSIDEKGAITWKTTTASVGLHHVSLKVQETQKRENVAIQSFDLYILPPLKLEKKVVFSETIKECNWLLDGNLSMEAQSFRARREQTIALTELPQNAIIIDLLFSFPKQPVLYRDGIILTMNDFILMMSHKSLSSHFEKSSDFPFYQWNKIVGKKYANQKDPVFCLGQDAGLGRCAIPPNESNGLFILEIADSLIEEVSKLAYEKDRKYNFSLTVTGDDGGGDCQHSEISFDTVIYYIMPETI